MTPPGPSALGDEVRRPSDNSAGWFPSRWWALLVVTVRAIVAIFLCVQANRLKGLDHFQFYDEAPDTPHYLQPADNLLHTGAWLVYPEQPLTRAGRMPAYGLTYLGLRLISGPTVAKTMLVCLQVLLSGLATYYFALTAYLLLRRRVAFYLALALYATALFVADWDYRLMTESLAASSSIFWIYLLMRYRTDRRRRHLIIASLWFAYLVFLRPFAAPLLLGALPFAWPPATAGWKRLVPVIGDLTLLASVFVIADTIWIARNYALFGRIVPIQSDPFAGYNYSPAQIAQFRWLQALGHDLAPLPQNLAAWYRPRVGFPHDRFVMPPYVVTSRCSLADIQQSRQLFDVAVYDPRPDHSGPADQKAVEILTRCRDSFAQEKRLQYQVLARARLLKAFFIHAGPTLSLPPFRSFLHRRGLVAFKVFAVGTYWLVLVSGIIGLVVAIQRRHGLLLAAASPFLWVAVLFPLVLRAPEIRYLVTGYPALCLLAVVALEPVAVRAAALRKRFRPASLQPIC